MRSLAIARVVIAAMSLPLFPAGAAAATLNECKLADGRTIFLWEKCPDGAAATPPATSTPPAAAPAPRKAPEKSAPAKAAEPAPAPTPGGPFKAPAANARQIDSEMVIEIMSGYTVCSDDVEGFRGRYSAAYDFWKLRNTASIARVQSDPAARRAIAERIAEGRSASGGTDPEKRNYCEKLIGPFLTGKFAG